MQGEIWALIYFIGRNWYSLLFNFFIVHSTCLCLFFFLCVHKQPVETSQPCRETRITRTSTLMSRSSSSSYKTSRNRWSCTKEWAVCFRTNRTRPDVFAPCLPADHVSRVSGPAEEHDLHVRPRHLSALWGPNERVPHLPKGHRAPHPPLLDPPAPTRDPSPPPCSKAQTDNSCNSSCCHLHSTWVSQPRLKPHHNFAF